MFTSRHTSHGTSPEACARSQSRGWLSRMVSVGKQAVGRMLGLKRRATVSRPERPKVDHVAKAALRAGLVAQARERLRILLRFPLTARMAAVWVLRTRAAGSDPVQVLADQLMGCPELAGSGARRRDAGNRQQWRQAGLARRVVIGRARGWASPNSVEAGCGLDARPARSLCGRLARHAQGPPLLLACSAGP